MSGMMDMGQAGLGVLGMIPGVGNVADLANAGISGLRGDKVGAATSLAAAVPGAGFIAGGANLAQKGSKFFKGLRGVKNVLGVTKKPMDIISNAKSGIEKISDSQYMNPIPKV